MDSQTLRIKEMFEEFLPRFGTSHAKVYRALMHEEIKTAKQLHEETDISYHKIYSVLKDLEGQGVLVAINTKPINYHMKNAEKIFEKLVKKKVKGLEKMTHEFGQLINDEATEVFEKEYLIKIDIKNKQTKLFDNKNKIVVKEAAEAKKLIEELNSYAQALEPKKEYTYALYR